MTLVNQRADVPVTIDESLWIEGCTLCVDVCPLDSLAINPDNGKAYMHVDECWYCGPCAARCPTGAVTVNMPYLFGGGHNHEKKSDPPRRSGGRAHCRCLGLLAGLGQPVIRQCRQRR